MGKVFVFDASKCNGCYGCQFACKDEHWDNEWAPYAKPQPLTGQFWCKLNEKDQGQVPRVRVAYWPVLGAQDQAIREYAPEALMEREDGLIVLDPEKCKGRRDLAEKFEGVYYNEELDIAQGCTGCAHLVDAGETPHCVELCVLKALRFGDEEEFAEELANAEKLSPTSNVYYLNMPHLFIGGGVWDPVDDEVLIGAKVTLAGEGIELATETDEFGDFWFKRIDAGSYRLAIEAEGFKPVEKDVELTESLNVGDFALERA